VSGNRACSRSWLELLPLRVVFALCVAVSTAAGSVVAGAANQEAGTAAPHGDRAPAVFRSAVDLVALNVIVTDAKQRFVKGLQLSDFVVFEEGVTQDVTCNSDQSVNSPFKRPNLFSIFVRGGRVIVVDPLRPSQRVG
jgi:hypothetical protein